MARAHFDWGVTLLARKILNESGPHLKQLVYATAVSFSGSDADALARKSIVLKAIVNGNIHVPTDEKINAALRKPVTRCWGMTLRRYGEPPHSHQIEVAAKSLTLTLT